MKSFLASETNLNSVTTLENNDEEESLDEEDETNYVNIIQSNISALSNNQAQWSPQQFTEEQDLAHNPVEDPAETNYINLINHLSPDIKEMEWLPHASSPVDIPVAGVQSTPDPTNSSSINPSSSSSTRPATPKATAAAAALVQTGLQPTQDPASSSSFNPSSTRAAAGAAAPTESVAAAALVKEPPEHPPPVDWGELSLDPDPDPWYIPELGTTDPDSQTTASSEKNGSLPKQPSRRTRPRNPLLKSSMIFWFALAIVGKLGVPFHIIFSIFNTSISILGLAMLGKLGVLFHIIFNSSKGNHQLMDNKETISFNFLDFEHYLCLKTHASFIRPGQEIFQLDTG